MSIKRNFWIFWFSFFANFIQPKEKNTAFSQGTQHSQNNNEETSEYTPREIKLLKDTDENQSKKNKDT